MNLLGTGFVWFTKSELAMIVEKAEAESLTPQELIVLLVSERVTPA